MDFIFDTLQELNVREVIRALLDLVAGWYMWLEQAEPNRNEARGA